MDNWNMVDISDMVGKVVQKITLTENETVITFYCNDGIRYVMMHNQDCCETVYVDDVDGDLSEWIDVTVLFAEETSNHESDSDNWESITWTFYKLASVKDYLNIRWIGSSNGYYSESVDLYRVTSGDSK